MLGARGVPAAPILANRVILSRLPLVLGGPAFGAVVKHLHIGHHYAVTIAIGRGAAERHFTRQITLSRATVKGIRPAGDASPACAFPASRGAPRAPWALDGPASRAVPS